MSTLLYDACELLAPAIAEEDTRWTSMRHLYKPGGTFAGLTLEEEVQHFLGQGNLLAFAGIRAEDGNAQSQAGYLRRLASGAPERPMLPILRPLHWWKAHEALAACLTVPARMVSRSRHSAEIWYGEILPDESGADGVTLWFGNDVAMDIHGPARTLQMCGRDSCLLSVPDMRHLVRARNSDFAALYAVASVNRSRFRAGGDALLDALRRRRRPED